MVGVEPVRSAPGYVLVSMNRRPMFLDLFWVEVATGETTLHLERTEPRGDFLLDRDGRAAFYSYVADDGTQEFSAVDPETGERRFLHRVGGPEHPMGIYLLRATPGRGGPAGRRLPGLRRPAAVRIDRETGEETVVAAVDGPQPGHHGHGRRQLPPTVFTSRRTGEVLAARFVGDRPASRWWTRTSPRCTPRWRSSPTGCWARCRRTRRAALGRRRSSTTASRGLTWFYDHGTGESRLLFRPHPHLDPADLAPMTPVGFPARDGLPLHGFLTLPVGVEPAGLPLVLVVHGGPWAHDTVGLRRGGAVPGQPRLCGAAASTSAAPRATDGGTRIAAIGEFARTMHDDLIDAVDWAVGEGYADPDRVGISAGPTAATPRWSASR